MIAKKNNHQSIVDVLENNPPRQSSAALENIPGQFANADSAVDMRVAERLCQLKQSEHDADPFGLRQPADLL